MRRAQLLLRRLRGGMTDPFADWITSTTQKLAGSHVLVVERWEGGTRYARWTTERPGVSGPPNLVSLAPRLVQAGWLITWESVA